MAERSPYVRWFAYLNRGDVWSVPGKNASLAFVEANDRDSGLLTELFDERDEAVTTRIAGAGGRHA